MKKIDLHLHTVSSNSDRDFTFSLDKLNEYIASRGLDGIAITNHNLFDLIQFKQIEEAVSIQVFPGIEIDLDDGHLLLIADGSELADFDAKCKAISAKIPAENDSVTITELKGIFPDLSKYILIPHYSKKPAISAATLEQLASFITAGEVASPKKFRYCLKDKESLVPTYFSDQRIDEDLTDFSVRQTYIDCLNVDFPGLKICLQDKNKVFLAKEDGHHFFDALTSGVKLSTGLNVILGERSTGKSYTLNQVYKTFHNVKYIKQFSLLERDEESDKKRFNELLTRRQSVVTQEHLKPFKDVVDKMIPVDLEQNERDADRYLDSLLKNAQESENADSFSSANLFNEVEFSESDFSGLKLLIDSARNLIENTEYRELIEQHVEISNLKFLAVSLMNKYAEENEQNLKKRFLNDLIGNIKKGLQVRAAATPIDDVDFYMLAMNRQKVSKFNRVANALKRPSEIQRKDIQGFKVVATRKPFGRSQELKNMSGRRIAFSTAFSSYKNPYSFLKALRSIEELEETEYFKYFAQIEYRILNKYETDVSGGERSEFRLLQEINDAQKFDMLLIDEPESSFDNLFLMNSVNELIKDISKSIPVVIVTHNSTVGASIKPDFVVYTRKIVDQGKVQYEVYSGHPSDKTLKGLDGKEIPNLDALLNCLEAGSSAYNDRGNSYEILKN